MSAAAASATLNLCSHDAFDSLSLLGLAARLFPTMLYFAVLRFILALRNYVFYWVCQGFPRISRYVMLSLTKRQLPSRIKIDPHFSPNYKPWDQRVCLVPDGDMFKALRDGNADIATGKIDTVTEKGLRLEDGTELEADCIVCATGLNLKLFGGATLIVDGEKVDTNKRWVFRGQMLSGVPNASLCFGYTNASWTLGSDVCVLYATRLLNEMHKRNISHFAPRGPPGMSLEKSEPMSPLQSGYFLRAKNVLPRSAGTSYKGGVWAMRSNWFFDWIQARYGGAFDHMDVHYAPKAEAKKIK